MYNLSGWLKYFKCERNKFIPMVITIDVFLKICAGISCVGLAMSYLLKTIRSLKKPVDDINKKFQAYDDYFTRDKNKIEELEKSIEDNAKCMRLLLEAVYSMLGHFEDGNNTNMLREEKKKIENFLYEQLK